MDKTLEYTLNLPTLSDVIFNENGLYYGDGQDGYFLTNILGGDGAPLRTPNDNAPQTHGGLIHDRYKGPRITTWEGRIFVQTVRTGNAIAARREQMKDVLLAAMDDLLVASSPGTMTWTPRGSISSVSLSVLAQIPLETIIDPKEEAQVGMVFSFGLISANPDWS
jgi:hypothetical protein